MQWYLKCFKQYADFNGRARRMEYWMFQLINVLIYIVFGLIIGLLGDNAASLGMFVIMIYALAIIVPALAVTVRRFHDQDKSGWMVLVSFIPLVGGIIMLVFMCLDGTPGDNRFGPSPKA